MKWINWYNICSLTKDPIARLVNPSFPPVCTSCFNYSFPRLHFLILLLLLALSLWLINLDLLVTKRVLLRERFENFNGVQNSSQKIDYVFKVVYVVDSMHDWEIANTYLICQGYCWPTDILLELGNKLSNGFCGLFAIEDFVSFYILNSLLDNWNWGLREKRKMLFLLLIELIPLKIELSNWGGPIRINSFWSGLVHYENCFSNFVIGRF